MSQFNADAGVVGRADRRGRVAAPPVAVAVAHHQRVGGQVTEALVVVGDEDRDHADEVEGERVDHPHDVAQHAADERDRPPAAADDPQPRRALARRAAAAERLEQHVVEELHPEVGEREDRHADRAVARVDEDEQRDQRQQPDREVDHPGDEARAEAGQRELDLNALGSRDREAILEADGDGAGGLVDAHTPTPAWMLTGSRVSARQAGRSSRRWCGRRARGRRGSAPSGCWRSGGATGRPPPTSRSPAGCSRTNRRRGGSSGSSPTRARASTRPRPAAGRSSTSSPPATGSACASARCR